MKNMRNMIKESRRSDREGVNLPTTIDMIQTYVGEGYFMHFSELPKLGINPTSTFKTPLGIYAYPMTSDVVRNGKIIVPFAGDRQYIHIFKPKNYRKIIYFPLDDNRIGKYEEMLKSAGVMSEDDSLTSDPKLSPSDKFWRMTHDAVNSSLEWNVLFRKMGIDGFVDLGFSIIHEAEPLQAVFFSISAIEHVDMFENPWSERNVAKKDSYLSPDSIYNFTRYKKKNVDVLSYRALVMLKNINKTFAESSLKRFSKQSDGTVSVTIKYEDDPEETLFVDPEKRQIRYVLEDDQQDDSLYKIEQYSKDNKIVKVMNFDEKDRLHSNPSLPAYIDFEKEDRRYFYHGIQLTAEDADELYHLLNASKTMYYRAEKIGRKRLKSLIDASSQTIQDIFGNQTYPRQF